MDLDFVSVHKNAKRELGQYPAILTLRLVNNIYLYLCNTEVLRFQPSQSSLHYIKNILKGQPFKTSKFQFDNWLFGPNKFSGLSRNRPQDRKTEGRFKYNSSCTDLKYFNSPMYLYLFADVFVLFRLRVWIIKFLLLLFGSFFFFL